MSARRILVLDDEAQILRALRVILREAGYEVVPASTVAEALDVSAVDPPDAAILDLVLPDGDGVQVATTLREWSDMPIIVLSAVGEEAEKVRALEAGADDYVTKPFGPKELIARLEAALRRATPVQSEPVLRAGAVELDRAGRTVRVDGSETHLTRTEYGLLAELMTHAGKPLTHAALLVKVWGPAYSEDIATLRTHMANLRRKVDVGEVRLIRTEPGIGYRLVDPTGA